LEKQNKDLAEEKCQTVVPEDIEKLQEEITVLRDELSESRYLIRQLLESDEPAEFDGFTAIQYIDVIRTLQNKLVEKENDLNCSLRHRGEVQKENRRLHAELKKTRVLAKKLKEDRDLEKKVQELSEIVEKMKKQADGNEGFKKKLMERIRVLQEENQGLRQRLERSKSELDRFRLEVVGRLESELL
jgi:hypothetical protein